MITKSENLQEIIDFLSTRMKPGEKIALMHLAGVRDLDELKLRWPHNPEIREMFQAEVRKRATVADCTFKLPELPLKNSIKFVSPTFVSMTAQDD